MTNSKGEELIKIDLSGATIVVCYGASGMMHESTTANQLLYLPAHVLPTTPAPTPGSFDEGAAAALAAVATAKYDALQRGELDLQLFDLRKVKVAPIAVPPPKVSGISAWLYVP